MQRALLVGQAAILLVLTPASGRAGGFSYPDLGAAALSRAGAFVARADDPSALWYNPAGAALAPGTTLLVDVNIFNENIRFQRRVYAAYGADRRLAVPVDRYPHDPTQRMPEVQNDNSPFPIPFVGLTGDLGLGILRRNRLALLLGIFGPNAHPRRSYPSSCEPGVSPCRPPSDPARAVPNPARYDTLATDILVLNPSLGLAWRPLPWLSLGATFQAAFARFSIEKAVAAIWTSRGGQPTEDPAQDLGVRIDARDSFTPSGILGLHLRPLRFLELGVAAQLPLVHRCVGEAKITIPGTVLGAGSVYADPNPAPVEVELRFPWVVRSGVRFVLRDGEGRERFDLELDLVWESTSTLDALVVETDTKLGFTGFADSALRIRAIEQRYDWQDTWSLRLGGSYRFRLRPGLELLLRAGGFYESAAEPDETTRLDFLPLARLGLTAGLGLEWGRFRFSAGYARILHETRTVAPDAGDRRVGTCASSGGKEGCGSEAIQIVPIAPNVGKPVGDGTYAYSIDMVTLGVTVQLGR